MQMPHAFFKEPARRTGIQLAGRRRIRRRHGFLAAQTRAAPPHCEKILEEIIAEEGQKCLGWRTVPTDNMYLRRNRESVPSRLCGRFSSAAIRRIEDELAFERKLYVIRKRAENAIRYAGLAGGDVFLRPEPVLPDIDL